MRPLLVGELNPYGSAPEYALWPLPANCAGDRLARILGLSRGEYIRRFDRVNLCDGTWSAKAARARAAEIVATEPRRPACVLLGARVCAAFEFEFDPFVRSAGGFVLLPHPSGRCRIWNEPRSVWRARRLLREFL